jgi:translation initiation factor 5
MSLVLLLGHQHVGHLIQGDASLICSDPTKFFGCELGAQTTFANDRYIVNGSHTAERLRELLDTFIEMFVLCPSCKNPETELVITGKGNNEDIHRDCKACGRQNGINMRHKLTTFILRNPPQKDKKGKGSKGMTATANVGGPMVFEKGTNGNGNAGEGSDEDLQSPEAGMAAAVPTSGTDIDDALGRIDPILGNPDAAEEVSKKLESLNVEEDEEEDADSPYTALGLWLKENKDADDASIIAKIKEVGIIGKHKALLEIGQHLFTDDIAKEIGKRVPLLQVVSHTCIFAQGLVLKS